MFLWIKKIIQSTLYNEVTNISDRDHTTITTFSMIYELFHKTAIYTLWKDVVAVLLNNIFCKILANIFACLLDLIFSKHSA